MYANNFCRHGWQKQCFGQRGGTEVSSRQVLGWFGCLGLCGRGGLLVMKVHPRPWSFCINYAEHFVKYLNKKSHKTLTDVIMNGDYFGSTKIANCDKDFDVDMSIRPSQAVQLDFEAYAASASGNRLHDFGEKCSAPESRFFFAKLSILILFTSLTPKSVCTEGSTGRKANIGGWWVHTAPMQLNVVSQKKPNLGR
eukprot:Skav207359  [mRNA]  locus=scaffold426:204740:205832:- [translate_table: standard]